MFLYHVVSSRIFFFRKSVSKCVTRKPQHGHLAPSLLPPYSAYLRICCFNSKMVVHARVAGGGVEVSSSQMKKQNLPFQEGFNNPQLFTQ